MIKALGEESVTELWINFFLVKFFGLSHEVIRTSLFWLKPFSDRGKG